MNGISINGTTMKKIVYTLAAFSLIAVACNKEESTIEPAQEPEQTPVKVHFTAMIEDLDTKATIGETGTFQWESGDKVAIFTTDGTKVTLTASSTGASVEFTGEVPAGKTIAEGAVAYYPYSSVVDQSTVSYPASYASVDAMEKAFPMKATLSGTSLNFTHLGGIIRLTVKEIPAGATTATFTAEGCSGDFTATGTEIAKGTSSASVAITLGSIDKSNAVLNIPLPTGTYSGGFSLAFNDGTSAAKTTAKSFTITRKHVLPVKGFVVTNASDNNYRVVGQFNSWDPTAGTIQMFPVSGHSGWYVAERVTIGNADADGIKILTSDTEGANWYDNIGTEKTTARGTMVRIPVSAGSNNIFVATAGTYDVYYNSSFGVVVAPVGATMVKRINYLMEYLDNGSFNPNNITAHVWKDGGSDCDTWGEEPAPTGETKIIGNNIYQVIEYPLWDAPRNNFWDSGTYGIIPKRGVNGWRLCGSSAQYTFTVGSETDYYFHVGRYQYAQIPDPAAEITSFITAYGFFNNSNTEGVAGKVHGNWVVFKNLAGDGTGSRINLQDTGSNGGQTLGKSDSGSPTTGGDANIAEVYTPYMRWQDGTNNSIKINGLDKTGATSYDIYYNLLNNQLHILLSGNTPADF